MKSNAFWNRLARLPKDYYRLLGSRVFMHTMYSRRYFKTKLLAWLSLPHYILFGESRGFYPNPFFHPPYFERRSGTRRLVDYLEAQPLWGHAISCFFDSRWYIEKNSASLATNENPLQHFWHIGFDRRLDPSPHFDMQFLARAIARDRVDRKNYAYEYLCQDDRHVLLNAAELEQRQSDFYASIRLETLKKSERKRRFLLFVQSGREFVPDYSYATAIFDTLINYYDESAHIPDKVEHVFRQSGSKVTAVRKILEADPDVLLGYESVLLLDDDVTIAQQQIETLFLTQEEQRLDLLQAALTENSSCFFPVLRQPLAGKGLRRITAIETMMPLISRRVLQECAWVFKEGISGWGVDTLLSTEVRKRFGNTVALLSDVVCFHARAVDTSAGAFYKFLYRHGIEPTIEAGKIAMKFGINDKMSAVHFLDEALFPEQD
jgi:hypothetical protein